MLDMILIFVIIFAFMFEFINGFHDTANAIATSVYTKALTPGRAILLAAVMNFIGALVSERVASTISKNLVSVQLAQYVILAALPHFAVFPFYKVIEIHRKHIRIGCVERFRGDRVKYPDLYPVSGCEDKTVFGKNPA